MRVAIASFVLCAFIPFFFAHCALFYHFHTYSSSFLALHFCYVYSANINDDDDAYDRLHIVPRCSRCKYTKRCSFESKRKTQMNSYRIWLHLRVRARLDSLLRAVGILIVVASSIWILIFPFVVVFLFNILYRSYALVMTCWTEIYEKKNQRNNSDKPLVEFTKRIEMSYSRYIKTNKMKIVY